MGWSDGVADASTRIWWPGRLIDVRPGRPAKRIASNVQAERVDHRAQVRAISKPPVGSKWTAIPYFTKRDDHVPAYMAGMRAPVLIDYLRATLHVGRPCVGRGDKSRCGPAVFGSEHRTLGLREVIVSLQAPLAVLSRVKRALSH